MNRLGLALLLGATLILSSRNALAASPPLVSFQAFVTEDHDGDPATPEIPVVGARSFRFSVWVDATATLPAAEVWWEQQNVTVVDGQLSAMLGRAAVVGGATSGPLDDVVFKGPNRWLEIEDLGAGTPMTPRIRLGSMPFSLRVDTLDGASGGSVSGNLTVSGALTAGSLKLANGAADGYVLVSDANGNASWQESSGDGSATHATSSFKVKTNAGENIISLFTNKAIPMIPKSGDASKASVGLGARLEMTHVDDPTGLRAVLGGGSATGGGSLELFNNGYIGVHNDLDNQVLEFDSEQANNDQPIMTMWDAGGELAFRWRAASNNLADRPQFSMLDGGNEYVEIVADQANHGTHLYLRNTDDSGTLYDAIAMETDASDGGATIWLRDRFGSTSMILDADQDTDPGNSRIRMQNGGTDTIVLSASDGRVKTQVLEITGGSDLSEQFDVRGEVEPGAVVCIDPANAGQLVVSSREYDRTVAGIVSGAGGVETGMIMGQKGSIADGQHAIALTGRVYVKADASRGAIRPGDLLTTSDRPGHAMRVDDHARATGSVLGKAMTELESGEGLVLVLVGLQ